MCKDMVLLTLLRSAIQPRFTISMKYDSLFNQGYVSTLLQWKPWLIWWYWLKHVIYMEPRLLTYTLTKTWTYLSCIEWSLKFNLVLKFQKMWNKCAYHVQTRVSTSMSDNVEWKYYNHQAYALRCKLKEYSI